MSSTSGRAEPASRTLPAARRDHGWARSDRAGGTQALARGAAGSPPL